MTNSSQPLASWFSLPALVIATSFGMGVSLDAQRAEARAETQASEVAAMVGDTTVTVTELEEMSQGRLLRLRSDEYGVKRQILEETIARLLIEREAKARGISSGELIRIEVEARVAPITEAETRAAYQITSDRATGEPESRSLDQIEAALRQRRINDRRQEFVESLRAGTDVRVLLDPPRLHVDNEDAPFKGPQHAPITIVEFSDFQCSYCARVMATLKQLQVHYGDKLRIVFRHFPLPMHKEGAKASEAALCAGEQQKFWEMHDRLFGNQSRLQPSFLKQHAMDLGLDGRRFNECLDSGKHAQKVRAEVSDGSRYGVTGTPAFFINGRPLVGAVPYESFVRLIEEELAHAGSSPSPRSAPDPSRSAKASAGRPFTQQRGPSPH
jgi:protein-disulfide isomerase